MNPSDAEENSLSRLLPINIFLRFLNLEFCAEEAAPLEMRSTSLVPQAHEIALRYLLLAR